MGKFEVTRAQYAEFNSDYDPVTGNYPVNDISAEQAQAYCKWLSELTGKKYRLPSKKEAENLFDMVESTQEANNLNYWAGYDINIDDAGEIKNKINELNNIDELLKPEGSFTSAGKNNIYNLGGNVAEWCQAANELKILGASAITPVNIKSEYKPPKQKYVGFRVILED